jgi:hypothetical protein
VRSCTMGAELKRAFAVLSLGISQLWLTSRLDRCLYEPGGAVTGRGDPGQQGAALKATREIVAPAGAGQRETAAGTVANL